jgi:DNA-binding phage protein
MDKKKTSKERKTCSPKLVKLKTFKGLEEWSPKTRLLNKKFILKAVVECLKNGDAEGAVEVVMTYIRALNRHKLSRDTHVSISTIEHCLQHGNPTIETAFKLLSA